MDQKLQIIIQKLKIVFLHLIRYLGVIGKGKIDFEDLKLEALKEDPKAQYMLGYNILHEESMDNLGIGYGEDINKDEREAVLWLKKAANQGHQRARYKLGKIYENGTRTIIADDTQALEWYEKAGYQGNEKAQHKLAEMYETGRGTRRDNEQAKEWHKRAMNNPNTNIESSIRLKERAVAALNKYHLIDCVDEELEESTKETVAKLQKDLKKMRSKQDEYKDYPEE